MGISTYNFCLNDNPLAIETDLGPIQKTSVKVRRLNAIAEPIRRRTRILSLRHSDQKGVSPRCQLQVNHYQKPAICVRIKGDNRLTRRGRKITNENTIRIGIAKGRIPPITLVPEIKGITDLVLDQHTSS